MLFDPSTKRDYKSLRFWMYRSCLQSRNFYVKTTQGKYLSAYRSERENLHQNFEHSTQTNPTIPKQFQRHRNTHFLWCMFLSHSSSSSFIFYCFVLNDVRKVTRPFSVYNRRRSKGLKWRKSTLQRKLQLE